MSQNRRSHSKYSLALFLRVNAPATDEFRPQWRANKDVLKAAGLSWEQKNGAFTGNIAWWASLSAEEIAEERRTDEISRATKSEFPTLTSKLCVPIPKCNSLPAAWEFSVDDSLNDDRPIRAPLPGP